MKLIIDIPREVNERLRADYGHGYIPYYEDQRAIMEAIYNGKKVEETSKFAKDKDALISREAAIKAVSVGCEELRGVFYRCKKNINALPSAAPGWIPVSERLPKTKSWRTGFIVTTETKFTTVAKWENTTIRGKEVSRWIWDDKICPFDIIAWMPLPEPYKEDKHE